VERELASLALHPQITVSLFSVVDLKFTFDENLFFLWLTGFANYVVIITRQRIVAAYARSCNFNEGTKSTGF
jgi:hypothetical protein